MTGQCDWEILQVLSHPEWKSQIAIHVRDGAIDKGFARTRKLLSCRDQPSTTADHRNKSFTCRKTWGLWQHYPPFCSCRPYGMHIGKETGRAKRDQERGTQSRKTHRMGRLCACAEGSLLVINPRPPPTVDIETSEEMQVSVSLTHSDQSSRRRASKLICH